MHLKREEKYFVSLLIWRQNHSKLSQNILLMGCIPINMIVIETSNSKKIPCPGSRYNKELKNNIDLISQVERMHFYKTCFK